MYSGHGKYISLVVINRESKDRCSHIYSSRDLHAANCTIETPSVHPEIDTTSPGLVSIWPNSIISGQTLHDVLPGLVTTNEIMWTNRAAQVARTEIGGYFGGCSSENVPGRHSTTAFRSCKTLRE